MNNSEKLTAGVIWSGVLAVAWAIYAQGLGGAFLLDDVPNLSGLAKVDDATSAINFVLSGNAGPLGRPVALMTFLLQADEWEQGPVSFLTVNILIHLCNACLLWGVLYRLLEGRSKGSRERLFLSGAGASLWMLMPLLASASLMVVQRMTTLSATFVLLGLLGYLFARHDLQERPNRAMAGMSAALVLGTLLASFTKENGALLPIFVLVLEATLLPTPRLGKQAHWRAWKFLFLVMPTVLILAYLIWRIPYSAEMILRRDFTAWERLLTQSRILWEYVFNAFLPRPGQFGPFHDGYPVARTVFHPATFVALSGWVVAATLAMLWRRRYPLFGFAVLWFLGGQLLESTVIPLDLYYEHRNYLPILGPVFALCALLGRVPSSHQKLAYAGATAYIIVSALMLFNLTALWGNPSLAFRYWQERTPESVYAATAAMAHAQATQGPAATLGMIREFIDAQPKYGYVGIYEVKLACMLDRESSKAPKVEELKTSLKDVEFSYTAARMLSQLAEFVNETTCRGVNLETSRELARALLDNPRYRINRMYNQLHHQFMALTYQYEGNNAESLRHVRKAVEYKPSTSVNEMMVIGLASSGDLRAARRFIDRARAEAPIHPLKRYVWLSRLDQLDEIIAHRE